MKASWRILLLGQDFRGDDGFGPAVGRALDPWAAGQGDVTLMSIRGDAAQILDALDGAQGAVVVDALRGGGPPGLVRVFDLAGGMQPGPETGAETSSHGFGLAQALALGHTLGGLPQRLALVGGVGLEFGMGAAMGEAVRASVSPACEEVKSLYHKWIDEVRCA